MSARTAPAPPPAPVLSRRRRIVFTGVMLLIPVLFFAVLEGGLRLADYGDDYPLFEPLDENPQYLVRNADIARRYFAQQASVPAPLHDVFAAQKGDDEYRVFVQGGSTAAGFPFYGGGAFSRMLERRLQDTFPDRTIEVINTAMDAVSSYTLLDLADEIVAQEPDAVLIYAGHNEYYGALGVGSAESLGRFRGLVNVYLRLRHVRTVQLLRNVLAGLGGGAEAPTPDGGGEADGGTMMAQMAGEQTVPYGSPEYELGLRQFRSNLSDLLATYERAGVPVFIATVASNERDQRPFVSAFAAGTDEAAWREAYDRGVGAGRRGDLAEARAAFAEAVRLDSLAADGFYALARVEEALGDTAAAREAFVAARDRDALRFRAPRAINAVIRDVAAAHGATVVAAEARLRQEAPGGTIGKEHMLEHLHPTLDGYFLIADAFYDALREAGAIGDWSRAVPDDLARRDLPLTPADSLVGLLRVRRMTSYWPFVPEGQPVRRGDTLTVRTPFDRIVQALYTNEAPWLDATGELATVYEQQGDLEAALQARQAVVSAYPMFGQPYLGLGGVYFRAGRLDEAADAFRKAAEREPRSPDPLSMLGAVEVRRGDVPEAIGYYEEARALAPGNPQVLYNLGVAYAFAQRYAEARGAVEALLHVQPDHAQARALLASLPPIGATGPARR
ncbi:tetratricopeptide repeat protein [Rubrivirga marina]|uniref:SGNH hydrolase-type esterase domain-containing protein n=1 Tax=Rubrivirga marina TaxID=1196024 RepID=A0A271IV91_9BACT|nr:tetratricopeptide repeat protein [Rubrivirga marina]PAP75030.1 hypothetical protein BSZ37_00460 [Rubrivirga marina]